MNESTLLSVTGLRSGNTYNFTVNYVRSGNTLIVMCEADQVWWKNLLYGAPVTLELDGEEVIAYARTYTNVCDVARRLDMFLQKRPALASLYGVRRRRNGRLYRRDLTTAAQRLVAIEIQLTPQLALV